MESSPPSRFAEISLRYYRIERREDGIVVVRRLTAPFDSAEELEREREGIRVVLDRQGRKHTPLLIDSRCAPTRTDFELKEPFRRLRREIQRGFSRVAVLVDSKLGVLQATRIAREDAFPEPLRVYDNEEQALTALLDGFL